jgi:hypothetical protein
MQQIVLNFNCEQFRDELRVMWKDEEQTGGGVVSTSTRLGSICFTYVFVPHTSEEQHKSETLHSHCPAKK